MSQFSVMIMSHTYLSYVRVALVGRWVASSICQGWLGNGIWGGLTPVRPGSIQYLPWLGAEHKVRRRGTNVALVNLRSSGKP